MSSQTPRINAAYLEKWVNHTVRIVGKVTRVQGDMANIDSAGPVTLQLTRVCYPTAPIVYIGISMYPTAKPSEARQSLGQPVGQLLEQIGKKE
jgi:hypothetical protein